jgi:hypothetical protein
VSNEARRLFEISGVVDRHRDHPKDTQGHPCDDRHLCEPKPSACTTQILELVRNQIDLLQEKLEDEIGDRRTLCIGIGKPSEDGDCEQQQWKQGDQRVLRDRRGIGEILAPKEPKQGLPSGRTDQDNPPAEYRHRTSLAGPFGLWSLPDVTRFPRGLGSCRPQDIVECPSGLVGGKTRLVDGLLCLMDFVDHAVKERLELHPDSLATLRQIQPTQHSTHRRAQHCRHEDLRAFIHSIALPSHDTSAPASGAGNTIKVATTSL